MINIYTTTVKPKKEIPSTVKYQGILIGFCMVHSEFEASGLPIRDIFDHAREDVTKGIQESKKISPIVIGMILETITKGDDITLAMYVRSNRDGNYQCIETLDSNSLKGVSK